MSGVTLAVIGGSGLYEIEGLSGVTELAIETPFGPPSDVIVKGTLGDTTLLFLPRHGRGHRIPPHAINYRANVAALKMCGATHLLSVSAVGSMREEVAPGDFVIVDQFIDLTRRRASTFFDEGLVAHVGMADPVCDKLASAVTDAARRAGANVHEGGTYVCIEGPAFSTRAESHVYRSWGVSAIGMTAMPEARLAREAELPYAVLALATDYDSWHETFEDVSVETVVATIQKNVSLARRTIVELAPRLPDPKTSRAYAALARAIMTNPDAVPDGVRPKLEWLVGPYLLR